MLDIKSTTRVASIPVNIVHIAGDIDSSNFQTFQSFLDDQVANGSRHFILNFNNVNRISSAGLRVIHNLFNKLRELHKDVDDDELRKRMSTGIYKSPYLKVVNLSAAVEEVFRLGGFDIYIEIFQDEEQAVNSCH
ncbi:MAG: STAS domain-containing protein [Anaerolineales bacterium]|nr:STAS domain-containing protein [Anaerolineales bacterium]MCK6584192.1 STAS domain-containing protein [Anaerolineales bacterium]